VTVLLLRHAVANRRQEWSRPDRDRPLTPRGRREAAALIDVLAPFGVRRILSSPYARCVETVEPLATATGLTVEPVDELAEGAGAACIRLRGVLSDDAVVLCTHGDVIAELLAVLAPETPSFEPAKASTWVIEDDRARYLSPPLLRS
jgi:8-oxo-(d)GTP phosphatase